MKLLVSACLLGIDCKYNGKNNKNVLATRTNDSDRVIEVGPFAALSQISASHAVRTGFDFFRGAGGDDGAALLSAARAHV